MRTTIPLALLVLLIAVAIVMFGEKSIQSGSEALVRHTPEPVETVQGEAIDGSTPSGEVTTQTVAGNGRTEAPSPRERGVYRPRRHEGSASKASGTSWVQVPGTGIGLWPKPTG